LCLYVVNSQRFIYGKKMDQIKNGGIHDFRYKNVICISESFNTNISQQFFYSKITCVNSQHKNTNSKDDFVLKTKFKRSFERFLIYTKIPITASL